MKHLFLLTFLVALLALSGCEPQSQTLESPDKEPKKSEPRHTEEELQENLFLVSFSNQADKANAYSVNYAAALRDWISAHPKKKIISVLGVPFFSSQKGLQSAYVRTVEKKDTALQKVTQGELMGEFPPEYPIATLFFQNGVPVGVVGVTAD